MESKLITANTWFASMTRRPDTRTITWDFFRTQYLGRLRLKFHIKEAGFDEELEPVPAFVNHGAWLVVCPKCRGAEYAWEEGFFFCCSCKNSYMGHKYRRLAFPKDRAKIEELLLCRPLKNRHWTPGETVADLARENEEHAAELLPVAAEGGNHELD